MNYSRIYYFPFKNFLTFLIFLFFSPKKKSGEGNKKINWNIDRSIDRLIIKLKRKKKKTNAKLLDDDDDID